MSELLKKIQLLEEQFNADMPDEKLSMALFLSVSQFTEKLALNQPCSNEIGNVLLNILTISKVKRTSIASLLVRIIEKEPEFYNSFKLDDVLGLLFKDIGQWSERNYPITDRYKLLESIIYDLMYIANMHGYKLADCLFDGAKK